MVYTPTLSCRMTCSLTSLFWACFWTITTIPGSSTPKRTMPCCTMAWPTYCFHRWDEQHIGLKCHHTSLLHTYLQPTTSSCVQMLRVTFVRTYIVEAGYWIGLASASTVQMYSPSYYVHAIYCGVLLLMCACAGVCACECVLTTHVCTHPRMWVRVYALMVHFSNCWTTMTLAHCVDFSYCASLCICVRTHI